MSILDTPCRKKRDVPLAKGDKASFLTPEIYKLETSQGLAPLTSLGQPHRGRLQL